MFTKSCQRICIFFFTLKEKTQIKAADQVLKVIKWQNTCISFNKRQIIMIFDFEIWEMLPH